MARGVRVFERDRIRVRHLVHGGWTVRAAAVECGVSAHLVSRSVRDHGGMRCRRVVDRERHLSHGEREEISRGLATGLSFAQLGRDLGRPTSTVSREVNRNGGRDSYRAGAAQHRADDQCRRPKQHWFQTHPVQWARVMQDLRRNWSPEQITRRFRMEHGSDTLWSVSVETIYKSIYIQGRGELRRELARHLRSNREIRQPRTKARKAAATKSSIKGMVNVSERNKEADDRAVPGHWEGDLILGKQGRSQVGTLVERSTRYVHLVQLDAKDAATVAGRLSEETVRVLEILAMTSLTWDQGTEMADHATFTHNTGIPVYFCDPRSPWQRGSNENTNGLLRQYMPKGTDLSTFTQTDLNAIAHELNGRPRKTLGFMTPYESIEQLVATTA